MQLQAENVQECVKDFDKAIELDPDNSDIYHHRGQVSAISAFFENTHLSQIMNYVAWLNPFNMDSKGTRCLYYSKTSLIQTPKRQSQVSVRGVYITVKPP